MSEADSEVVADPDDLDTDEPAGADGDDRRNDPGPDE